MKESAMIAGERVLKLIDAVYLHSAVSNRCEFFISNDLAFISTRVMGVVQLSKLGINF
jgi:hypothetical protein